MKARFRTKTVKIHHLYTPFFFALFFFSFSNSPKNQTFLRQKRVFLLFLSRRKFISTFLFLEWSLLCGRNLVCWTLLLQSLSLEFSLKSCERTSQRSSENAKPFTKKQKANQRTKFFHTLETIFLSTSFVAIQNEQN